MESEAAEAVSKGKSFRKPSYRDDNVRLERCLIDGEFFVLFPKRKKPVDSKRVKIYDKGGINRRGP